MNELIQALPGLLRAAGDSAEEVAEAAAFVAWRRAAGAGVCEHSAPFRLFRKTLVVAVANQTWQRQLEAMSGQLLFRINSILGQALVAFIEFRIDEQSVRRERLRRQPDAPDRAAIKRSALRSAEHLQDAAGAIHDEDLRLRFLRAAGSCIARRNERT